MSQKIGKINRNGLKTNGIFDGKLYYWTFYFVMLYFLKKKLNWILNETLFASLWLNDKKKRIQNENWRKKNLQVQQTPKPLAQEPAEVPPLFVHSELNFKIKKNYFDSNYIINQPRFEMESHLIRLMTVQIYNWAKLLF